MCIPYFTKEKNAHLVEVKLVLSQELPCTCLKKKLNRENIDIGIAVKMCSSSIFTYLNNKICLIWASAFRIQRKIEALNFIPSTKSCMWCKSCLVVAHAVFTQIYCFYNYVKYWSYLLWSVLINALSPTKNTKITIAWYLHMQGTKTHLKQTNLPNCITVNFFTFAFCFLYRSSGVSNKL